MQAGSFETLIENLPAFPDNMDYVADSGTFWVCFVTRASKLIQKQMFRSRHLRAACAYLPRNVLARVAPPVAGGMEFDADGNVLNVIVDEAGATAQSTSSGVLHSRAKQLVLGNLHHDYLTMVKLD